ncbi:hypothetical protein JZ751_005697 [Albula glossodonta]|uniref:Uncharacterized protein n=1 Tax=Albula glossodonta TaxID=121402 RepID=A0A8T2MMC0_9TELE|nr:hypothetical protein JZ751_005697 [Albula glossodonta]
MEGQDEPTGASTRTRMQEQKLKDDADTVKGGALSMIGAGPPANQSGRTEPPLKKRFLAFIRPQSHLSSGFFLNCNREMPRLSKPKKTQKTEDSIIHYEFIRSRICFCFIQFVLCEFK